MTADEFLKKWQPSLNEINSMEEYIEWTIKNMDEFEKDLTSCPDKDKLIDGWSGFATCHFM